MGYFTPPDLKKDLIYQARLSIAMDMGNPQRKESALLALREYYLAEAFALLADRDQIKDGHALDIVKDILSDPDKDRYQAETGRLALLADQAEAELAGNPLKATLLEKSRACHHHWLCAADMPAKLVAALHKATLGGYDPQLSIEENMKQAQKQVAALKPKPASGQSPFPQPN